MRTLIYARYSSALQDKRSIEDQVRVCRDRAEAEGWTVVDTFSDFEISGKIFARPGLQAMLERVAGGGIDQVMAEALDRLARDEVDTPLIRRKIEFAGARIFTLSQGHVSELHTALQGAMDALQLKELAAKVRRGQRGRAAAGRATGGRAYGYRIANRLREDGSVDKGLTAIDEEQAGIVRRIFREFNAGKSPLAIAADLNREGVPSPSGGLWRVSTINGDRIRKNGILQNELYRGRIVYNKTRRAYDPETRKRVIRSNPPETWQVTEVPGLRIVAEEQWAAVELHRERVEGVPFHRRQRPRRLLSGLGRCASCGGGWVVIGKDKWGCAARRDGRGCANNRTIENGEYERRVLSGLRDRLLEPAAVDRFVKEYRREFARLAGSRSAETGRLRGDLEQSEARIARYVAAIGDGAADYEEVRGGLADAKAARDAAREALAQAKGGEVIALHPGIADAYRRNFEQVRAALEADPDARRVAIPAIRDLMDRIELTPAGEGRRGVDILVYGRLTSLLALATGDAQAPARMFKVVPSVRHGRESTLVRAAV